jgi:hypothetical protein
MTNTVTTKKVLAIKAKKSKIGRGAFPTRQYRRNQILAEVTGRFVEDGVAEQYCVDMGQSGSFYPDAPFRYLNHSCDPNCELIELTDRNNRDGTPRLWLSSLRPIREGEELTIDYAWPADCAIRCLCGAPNCRGWVVDRRELSRLVRRATGGRRTERQ